MNLVVFLDIEIAGTSATFGLGWRDFVRKAHGFGYKTIEVVSAGPKHHREVAKWVKENSARVDVIMTFGSRRFRTLINASARLADPSPIVVGSPALDSDSVTRVLVETAKGRFTREEVLDKRSARAILRHLEDLRPPKSAALFGQDPRIFTYRTECRY